MKYLKKFKSSNINLKETIEDMLDDLDLEECRVPLSYSVDHFDGENSFKVRFSVKHEQYGHINVPQFFQMRDYNSHILPFIKRIKSYGIQIDETILWYVVGTRIEKTATFGEGLSRISIKDDQDIKSITLFLRYD